MAIAPLPSSFSLPPPDLRSFPPSWRSQELDLQRSTTISHLARRSFCCFGRKSRRGGASKSNKELCDELRQFIAVMGLPERQLPSMRELCINGRKDLANIVRWRGYKAITKLLLNSNEENDSEQSSERNQDPISAELYEATGEDSKLYQDLASEVLEEHDQNDIDRFKSLLLQREMKLSQLKQQIEDEERAMCNLEARAAVKLDDIQRIIAEKDVELCAAEEHLNGLKEVHIDYWENGQIVDVAGSFNGWQHRVTMDLHTSSEHVDPPTSRKQCLWSTVLWLFPGVYEIKFIVDGHWKIDPRREIITSGGITNNVLVVDG